MAARTKGRNVDGVWHRVTDDVWDATPETAANWADIQWHDPLSHVRRPHYSLPPWRPTGRRRARAAGAGHHRAAPERHLYQRDGITYHACGDR
jgi:hypothetical protein